MSADVDIDFADRNDILNLIKHIPARQETNTESKHHNSGVYVTDILYDPIHDCASIDYKEADERGYFKIDFLNVSVYKQIKDQTQYDLLLTQEPSWKKLLEKEFCEQIIHIGNHYELVHTLQPNSIPRMAMFLALIRPAKRHLLDKSWEEISKTIWDKPIGGSYYFKKAHAISYAMLVALHMNIIQHAELE